MLPVTDPRLSNGATITKPPTTLAALPPASEVVFPGLFAWSPISTGSLTAALHLDRGLWGTWKCRGLTPPPMPMEWFRRAPGAPLVYRVDHILSWIAARRGDQLDTLDAWQLSLARDLGTEVASPTEIRALAIMYARAASQVVGDVRFTAGGFQEYLSSLATDGGSFDVA